MYDVEYFLKNPNRNYALLVCCEDDTKEVSSFINEWPDYFYSCDIIPCIISDMNYWFKRVNITNIYVYDRYMSRAGLLSNVLKETIKIKGTKYLISDNQVNDSSKICIARSLDINKHHSTYLSKVDLSIKDIFEIEKSLYRTFKFKSLL